jgi:GH25 family lysozyme M1 (1,4-beta-N-acetylmuramidase)
VACFSHKIRHEPKFSRPKCDPDDYFLVEVNSSRKFARAAIPYPDPGTWNVVVRPFCSINQS